MPLKGALRDFSLPDLFQLIHFGKKNGTLVIANGDMMGYVCFRNGNVFFATHNWKRAPLGQRLIEAGMITQEQLDEALELQNTTHGDQRIGNILVELGHLGRESLEVFVEEHIRDAVFNLLRWNEGDFDFDPDQIFPEEDIGLSMSTEDLIMEGSRRLDEWFQIEKKVPSLDAVFKVTKVPGKDASEMNLTSEEWLVMYHVDGESTVRDIISRSGQSALVTCKALYGLVTAGLVVLASEPAEVTGAAAGLEDEVGVMLEEEAAAAPDTEREPEGAEEEVAVEEAGGETDEGAKRRKRMARSKKKAAESEDEVISFGDDADEGVTVEEVAVEDATPEAPRRSKLRRRGKKAEETLEEEPVKSEALAVEEEAVEVAGEQEPPDESGPDDSPAPGQSLVDYYKSLALRDFGDSEIYRETEERRAFIEQADRGELEGEEEREFEIVGSDGQEESAALSEEPQDIPLEWAGHLTRLRGRSSQPSRSRAQKAAREEEGAEPEAEVVELDAFAAAREEAAQLEDETASEHAEAREPASEVMDTEPTALDESVEVEPRPELLDEPALADDIMAGALEAIAGSPVAGGAAGEPVAAEPLSDEPASVEEAGTGVEEPTEEEQVETEAAELEDAEEAALEGEDEVQEAVETDAVVEHAVQAAEEVPLVPTIDESAAIDDASLPTEEDIERLIQVNPPARGDLSREELLAFDQPTYAIQESRDAGPPQGEVAPEFEVEPAAAEHTEAELEGTASRAQAADAQVAGGEPAGQVISFSSIRGEADVEVVLEHPEPIVTSTVVEILSIAEDLEVPVIEEVLGRADPVLQESEAERPDDHETAALSAEVGEVPEAPAFQADDEPETESVLEIVGLEDAGAEIIPLDAGRLRSAEELNVAPPESPEKRSAAEEGPGDEAFQVYGTALDEAGEAGEVLAGRSADEEPAIADDLADIETGTIETYEQEPIVTSGAADAQTVADWDETDEEAAPLPEAHAAAAETEFDYDHMEDLRDITLGHAVEAGQVEAAAEQVVEEEPELEVEAEAVEEESLYEEEEEEVEDDRGLMGSLKVSGKRGKGTSLVDLETFELEQELLELAGGVQQKKHKVAVDKTQPVEEEKKKNGRAGRSKGKEVDKGSVKKIINDLKNK